MTKKKKKNWKISYNRLKETIRILIKFTHINSCLGE